MAEPPETAWSTPPPYAEDPSGNGRPSTNGHSHPGPPGRRPRRRRVWWASAAVAVVALGVLLAVALS